MLISANLRLGVATVGANPRRVAFCAHRRRPDRWRLRAEAHGRRIDARSQHGDVTDSDKNNHR